MKVRILSSLATYIFFLVFISGCNSLVQESWKLQGGAFQSRVVFQGQTIDYAGIKRYHNRKLVYLILVGDSNLYFGSKSDPNGEGFSSKGQILTWSCDSKKTNEGFCQIGDQRFDLAKGSFFAGKLQGNKFLVQQFSTDFSGWQKYSSLDTPKLLRGGKGDLDELNEFIKKNPNVVNALK